MKEIHMIPSAGVALDFIEAKRKQHGMTQEALSEMAHPSDTRKYYRRVRLRGDIRLASFITYAHTIGYDVALIKKEE